VGTPGRRVRARERLVRQQPARPHGL